MLLKYLEGTIQFRGDERKFQSKRFRVTFADSRQWSLERTRERLVKFCTEILDLKYRFCLTVFHLCGIGPTVNVSHLAKT